MLGPLFYLCVASVVWKWNLIFTRAQECGDWKFGNNCSNLCHCQNDVACDPITGRCPNGCDIMWAGNTCSEYKQQDQIEEAAVYASNQSLSNNISSGTLVYTVPSRIGDKFHFVHMLNSSIIARFFMVTINRFILTLCEFHLRKGVCTTGRFGENCLHECHCKDGTTCDPATGYCPNKQCETGWEGNACDTRNNIITLIKEKVSTHMSSVYNDTWASYLAIDGNIGPDPLLCKCCARTNNAEISWWSIDLGQKYPLSSISLFGRIEVPGIGQQLEGFQMILSNTSLFDKTTFYKDTSSHISSSYTVKVHNQLARFIKVQRPGVLTLCEVSVQEGECTTGYFGDECARACRCLDNKPCSKSTGVCSAPFCQLGWRGMACDSECLPGTFGENCREHCFCSNGEKCTSDYGICPGTCEPGYHGPQCNKECLPGTFGENCREQCFCINGENCTKDNGICPGTCRPGYQGPQCNKETAFDQGQKTNSSAAASQKTNSSLTIGISAGASILVATVACFIIFKIYRRHRQNRAKDNNPYMQPNFNIATNNSDYDTLEVPPSDYRTNRSLNDQSFQVIIEPTDL